MTKNESPYQNESMARTLLHRAADCDPTDDPVECERITDLLNRVEDDRAHADAKRLRQRADEFTANRSELVAQAMAAATRAAADSIDPYEMRGNDLVRKSDGKVMEYGEKERED